jgi:hypothetical protein
MTAGLVRVLELVLVARLAVEGQEDQPQHVEGGHEGAGGREDERQPVRRPPEPPPALATIWSLL